MNLFQRRATKSNFKNVRLNLWLRVSRKYGHRFLLDGILTFSKFYHAFEMLVFLSNELHCTRYTSAWMQNYVKVNPIITRVIVRDVKHGDGVEKSWPIPIEFPPNWLYFTDKYRTREVTFQLPNSINANLNNYMCANTASFVYHTELNC